jgi:hypothetical protein
MEAEKKSIVKKSLKITSIIVGVIFLFVAILIALAWIFEDTIAKYAVDQINKQINTQIEYKDLRFSLIKRFPHASLQFTDVKAKEVTPFSKKSDLLQAKNIFIQFSIWDLISGDYVVKKVEVENARIRMRVFANGTDNFQIIKESKDTTATEFKFRLNSIKFKNVDFGYADYQSNQHYRVLFRNCRAKGDFSQDNYSMKLDGPLYLYDISYDSVQYIKNKEAYANLQFDVDNKIGSYIVKKGSLVINKIPFNVNGRVIYSKTEKGINCTVTGDNLKLHSFIEELPSDQKAYFSKFESSGDFKFNLKIKGSFNGPKPLSIDLVTDLRNGKITNKENNLSLDDVNFSLKYTNGADGTMNSSGLSFNNFSARLKSGVFKGKFNIKNLNKPKIDTDFKGEVDLSDLAQFLKNDAITSMSGKLQVDAKIKINLRSWDNITANDFLNSESSGKIILTNGNIQLKSYPLPIKIAKSDFAFSKSDILINEMKGTIGGSDFALDGSFVDILPFFFIENQKIQIDATLTSSYLNFDELMKSDDTKSKTGKTLSFSDNINFVIRLKNNKLKFGKFEASDITANLTMNKKLLSVSNLKLSIFGGNIKASGQVNGRGANHKFLTTVRAEINQVNVSKLFYSFNNFGQKDDGLTDKKINGTINTSIQMSAVWNPDLTPDMELLRASIDGSIENGELINYETLNALAKFVKVEDLAHVRFKKIKNKFEIRDSKIIIPEMEINSNAMNLQLSGIHKFNNDIDYHVKVRLSELLSKKARAANKENEDFGDIEDDGLERTTIFLSITGNTDKPVIKYDTKSVREKIVTDLKKEKQNLKQVLNKEFGLFSKDTTITKKKTEENKQKQKEKENTKKQENGKFVIDWDDN